MPASSTTVLDQIARFFILLSGAPAYWFTINTSDDNDDDDDDDDDGCDNDGRQRWWRLPAQVPFDGAL